MGGLVRKCWRCHTVQHVRLRVCGTCGCAFYAPKPKKKRKPSMRKYHDKPGRGVKECPNCNRYMGVRTYLCECGYDFNAGKETSPKTQAPRQITVFNEPGRGRKPCKCGQYVPVRSHSCPCGHVFSVDNPVEATREDSLAVKFAKSIGCGHYQVVLTPAGDCPLKLKNTDPNSVSTWAEEVMIDSQTGQFFAPEALRYWIGQFYPRYVSGQEGMNPKYIEACTSLSQYLNSIPVVMNTTVHENS